jgi:hypothetical protein
LTYNLRNVAGCGLVIYTTRPVVGIREASPTPKHSILAQKETPDL